MIYVIIWIILGLVSAMIAKGKGNSSCGGFILGVLLGPLGLLIAFFVPDDKDELRRKSGDTKKCPYCAEYVKEQAVICKHCGRKLTDDGFDINEYRRN